MQTSPQRGEELHGGRIACADAAGGIELIRHAWGVGWTGSHCTTTYGVLSGRNRGAPPLMAYYTDGSELAACGVMFAGLRARAEAANDTR